MGSEKTVTIKYDPELSQPDSWPWVVRPGTLKIHNDDEITFVADNVAAEIWFPKINELNKEIESRFAIAEGATKTFTISIEKPVGTIYTYSVLCLHGGEKQFAEGSSSPKMIIEE
jgi:hypothetical protein